MKESGYPSADEDDYTIQKFDSMSYEVTNYWDSGCLCLCSLGIAGWTRKMLVLEADEAILSTQNSCQNNIERRPYAQLGSVDTVRTCCCCRGVNSGLNDGNEAGSLSPGWGCDAVLTSAISSDLERRMVGRGNVAQIKAQADLAEKVEIINAKLDIALAHLGCALPETMVVDRD